MVLSVEGAVAALQPLIIFVIGMVIYAIFVHRFYVFISRKDVYKFVAKTLPARIVKYFVMFPIAVFLWFFVISALLAILAQSLNLAQIYMIAMALTATIRFTAYYDEDLSSGIAQLIPYSLLAIFLLDISQMSLSAVSLVLSDLPFALDILVYYFAFIVAQELILKLIFDIILWKKPNVHRAGGHLRRGVF